MVNAALPWTHPKEGFTARRVDALYGAPTTSNRAPKSLKPRQRPSAPPMLLGL